MKLKNVFIASLIFTLFLSLNSTRAFADGCNDLLRALSPSPSSIRVIGEKESAGEVLSPSQNFPYLDDGAYVYVIDRQGRIGFSKRVPDLNDSVTPLVSHRSVFEKMKQDQTPPPEVTAAGEFEIHLGRVSLLNNKSGTFRGDEKNLFVTEALLKRHGLNIEPGTERVDYARQAVPGKHYSELASAEAWVRIHQDPVQRELFESFQTVEREIGLRYPSPAPGKIDWVAFFSSAHPQLSRSSPLTIEAFYAEKPWAWVIHFLSKSQDFTEAPIEFERLIREFGPQKTRELFKKIPELEGFLER